MDIQAMLDAMSKSWRDERSRYHLTLGALIEALEAAKPDATVKLDTGSYPGEPDSYRGYYSDLAFAPSSKPITVRDFLMECRSALNKTFEGYKGGDFVMRADTPLWSASYGTSSDGRAMMGISEHDGVLVISTKAVD